MKNLFSERYGYQKAHILQLNEVPNTLRKRIWNWFQKCIEEGKILIKDEYGNLHMDRDKIIERIWDKFLKEDLKDLKNFYWIEEYI